MHIFILLKIIQNFENQVKILDFESCPGILWYDVAEPGRKNHC